MLLKFLENKDSFLFCSLYVEYSFENNISIDRYGKINNLLFFNGFLNCFKYGGIIKFNLSLVFFEER